MSAASYVLPEALDLSNAASVHRDLSALRGADLDIDAGEVRKLGGLGLQLLVAAGAAWSRDGRRLRIVNRSNAFEDALRLTGSSLPGDTP